MSGHYKIELRNLGILELWRISPGLGFFVGCAAKLLRFPIDTQTRIPRTIELTILEADQVPPDIRRTWEAPAAAFAGLGFHPAFHYTVPVLGPGHRSFASALIGPDARTAAQIMVAEVTRGPISRRTELWQCLSAFEDGTVTGVTSEAKKMNSPPEFEGLHLPGRSPEVLFRRHGERIDSSPHGRPIELSAGSLRELLVRISNRATAFHVQRGVYVDCDE
jgi:hypothetical protein